MKEIPWERTADGARAQLKDGSHKAIIPVLSLLHAATGKMTQLVLISADFNGTTAVFQRQIGIYLEQGARAEFMGVYRTDEDAEEGEHKQPVLCIRRSLWDRDQDIRRFREAQSKRAYVEGDGQIHSSILFISPEMYPEIVHLTEEAERIVRQGIAIDVVARPNHGWDSLLFQFDGGSLVFSLSYAPRIEGNNVFETWLEQWQRSFAEVDFSGGIIPDNGCFISYGRSLVELLKTFPD